MSNFIIAVGHTASGNIGCGLMAGAMVFGRMGRCTMISLLLMGEKLKRMELALNSLKIVIKIKAE